MRNAVILATGASVPDRILPNSYFDELLGEDVGTWLREYLNIYERRWCEPDEHTSDLCIKASRVALDRAGLEPSDINLIIVATDTPDYLSPSTASVVQYRLQAGHAGSFDINSACAGFIMAVDVGARYIRADTRYQNVLIIGAAVYSKFLDRKDKKVVDIFSDAAGAIILSAEEDSERGYIDGELLTLGQYYDGMGIYSGGTRQPLTPELIADGEPSLRLKYRFPPELNPQVWSQLANNIYDRNDLSADDFSHYVLSQLNINSIRATMKKLDQPMTKAPTSMEKFGYPGAACIPLTFNLAVESGVVKRGSRVMMIGSGSGLCFGAVAFKY